MLRWLFHRKDLYRRDWTFRTAWCGYCNAWRPWGIADRINLWWRCERKGSPLDDSENRGMSRVFGHRLEASMRFRYGPCAPRAGRWWPARLPWNKRRKPFDKEG